MSPPIRITIRENADHLTEAGGEGQIARAIPEWIQNLFLGCILAVGFGWGLFMEYKRGASAYTLIAAGVFISVIGALGIWLAGKHIKAKPYYTREEIERRYFQQTGRTETSIAWEFGETITVVSDPDGKSTQVPWPSVKRIVVRPKGVLLYTSIFVYYWFPKAAFQSETEYQSLVKLFEIRVSKFKIQNS